MQMTEIKQHREKGTKIQKKKEKKAIQEGEVKMKRIKKNEGKKNKSIMKNEGKKNKSIKKNEGKKNKSIKKNEGKKNKRRKGKGKKGPEVSHGGMTKIGKAFIKKQKSKLAKLNQPEDVKFLSAIDQEGYDGTKNEEGKPSIVGKTVISKCVEALYELIRQFNKRRNISITDDPQKLFLQITALQIPKMRSTVNYSFNLAHSFAKGKSICLIVRDRVKKSTDFEADVVRWRDFLISKGVTQQMDILTFRQLKSEYNTGQLKHRFVNSYDYFMADSSVKSMVGRTCGKVFYRKGLVAFGIRMDKVDIKSEFDKAYYKTILRIHEKGNSSSITVGDTSLTEDQVAENVMNVIQKLDKKFPGGIANIRTIYFKGHKTSAIPIYVSKANPANAPKPHVKPQMPKAAVPVTDELDLGHSVTVYPSGIVKSRQLPKDKSDKTPRIKKPKKKSPDDTLESIIEKSTKKRFTEDTEEESPPKKKKNMDSQKSSLQSQLAKGKASASSEDDDDRVGIDSDVSESKLNEISDDSNDDEKEGVEDNGVSGEDDDNSEDDYDDDEISGEDDDDISEDDDDEMVDEEDDDDSNNDDVGINKAEQEYWKKLNNSEGSKKSAKSNQQNQGQSPRNFNKNKQGSPGSFNKTKPGIPKKFNQKQRLSGSFNKNEPVTPGNFNKSKLGNPGNFNKNEPGTPGKFNKNKQGSPGNFNKHESSTPGKFNKNKQRFSGTFNRNESGTPGNFNKNKQGSPGNFNKNEPGTPGKFNKNKQGSPGNFNKHESGTPGTFKKNKPGTPENFNKLESSTPGKFNKKKVGSPGNFNKTEPGTPGKFNKNKQRFSGTFNPNESGTPGKFKKNKVGTPENFNKGPSFREGGSNQKQQNSSKRKKSFNSQEGPGEKLRNKKGRFSESQTQHNQSFKERKSS